ncbi:GTP-binding protein [Chthoniobacter flavus]|nr:GTP-binding protein [Chthoniobacter flavus]
MPESSSPAKARYIMIGGFLGAGKTTAVAKLAQRLTERGLKVGLITNDQGRELVDTQMLRAKGFATEEIPGGCFCCRFNSLVEAADRLTTASQPDVFIAEPVGSCTDLVATVTYPLRRIYGDHFTIAPVSVLVDPVRAARVLGLESGGNFSEKVIYIYKKQLEEADIIVINKLDLLGPERVDQLHAGLAAQFPRATVLSASARAGTNLDAWYSRLERDVHGMSPTMEVDYDVYADGEALLGWLNATVELEATTAFDTERVLTELARDIQDRLRVQHAEVAHLKMTYSPAEALAGEIAAVNLVRNDFVPELSLKLPEPSKRGQLIINLRAENAPEALAQTVRDAIRTVQELTPTLVAQLHHLEHFRPGRPTPTHRDQLPAAN